MNVTLRQLRAFVTVANLSSFTDAAKKLHLTQAALSVLVRQLETELGVRLLDRSTRRVRVSEAGRDLHIWATRILDEVGSAVASVTSLRDKKRGFVKVASSQMLSCTLVPPIIAAYARRFPDIQVKLTDTAPEEVLSRVANGEVELAIAPDVSLGHDIQRQTLVWDRHMLVCRRDSPLARKKRLMWRDLKGCSLIAPTRDFARAFSLLLERTGHEASLNPVYEVSYMPTAMAMVSAGLGVTFTSSYSRPLANGFHLTMRRLHDPEYGREICIYTRKNISLSPAAESFSEFVRDFVPSLPPASDGGSHETGPAVS